MIMSELIKFWMRKKWQTVVQIKRVLLIFRKARIVASKFFSEGNGAKAHTLVAMGHCHIDTAWLWTYGETRRKCARSWASQIELMKTYPDIVFTCSQVF